MPDSFPFPRRSIVRRILHGLAVAGWIALVAGCSAVPMKAEQQDTTKPDYEVRRGIVFDAAHKLALDVYTPDDARHAPVVVFFYGGAWQTGSRREYRFVGSALAAKGVVVVIPDYRKYPEVKFEGFMGDATNAVGWTRTHVSGYGGDPRTLFLMGYSAGAQMSALLATDASWLARVGLTPRDLAGFIGLAGVYFFPRTNDSDMVGIFGETPVQQRRAQAFDFVDGDEPPMLLLQGADDKMVNPGNVTWLANALHAKREPVEVHRYPGVDHDGIMLSLSRLSSGHDPELADILAFIRAHSGPAPASPPNAQDR